MVFLIFCASTLGQLLFKSKSDYHILMLGSGTLIVGVILVGLSIQLESFLILFIGAIISGFGQAFSFRAGLSTVNAVAPEYKQAEITSTFFYHCVYSHFNSCCGVGLLELGLASNLQVLCLVS